VCLRALRWLTRHWLQLPKSLACGSGGTVGGGTVDLFTRVCLFFGRIFDLGTRRYLSIYHAQSGDGGLSLRTDVSAWREVPKRFEPAMVRIATNA